MLFSQDFLTENEPLPIRPYPNVTAKTHRIETHHGGDETLAAKSVSFFIWLLEDSWRVKWANNAAPSYR